MAVPRLVPRLFHAATRRRYSRRSTLADEQKSKVDITSFIGAEARYPSGRCIFEELETWP
jgi:hypothetical protein